jgi:hypothetical protein
MSTCRPAQALGPRLRDSQIYAFESWAKEYRGDLGIALSPTSMAWSAFLRDFDLYFCKLFDGARHDSGDPFEWGERMLTHYSAQPRRSTHQDADLQRRADRAAHDRAVPAVPGPLSAGVRHRHQPDQ